MGKKFRPTVVGGAGIYGADLDVSFEYGHNRTDDGDVGAVVGCAGPQSQPEKAFRFGGGDGGKHRGYGYGHRQSDQCRGRWLSLSKPAFAHVCRLDGVGFALGLGASGRDWLDIGVGHSGSARGCPDAGHYGKVTQPWRCMGDRHGRGDSDAVDDGWMARVAGSLCRPHSRLRLFLYRGS